MTNRLRIVIMSAILPILFIGFPQYASAANASIFFAPNSGKFLVGSTISVSIVVNTGEHFINAVSTDITFPPDKLQIISPSVGTSFISIWTTQPTYSNTAGKLSFSGGLPQPGLKSSSAVLSTIQFRIKSAGTAILRFGENTQILANDGDGTNVLSSKSQAILTLGAAPPEGPAVVSSTHPDSNQWYNDRTATFSWEPPNGATGYSYLIDNSAKSVPLEKVTSADTSVALTAETDGIWYFHIRAVADDTWGGTTHFLFRIDTTPPAQFTAKLDRSVISPNDRAIVSFFTTDAASGLDHYEIKIINQSENNSAVSLFHEESSPYQLPRIPAGKYQLIVRAYDVSGNYTDSAVNLTITQGIFAFLGKLGILGWLTIGVGLLLLIIILFAQRRRRAREEELQPQAQPLPAQSVNARQDFPTQQL